MTSPPLTTSTNRSLENFRTRRAPPWCRMADDCLLEQAILRKLLRRRGALIKRSSTLREPVMRVSTVIYQSTSFSSCESLAGGEHAVPVSKTTQCGCVAGYVRSCKGLRGSLCHTSTSESPENTTSYVQERSRRENLSPKWETVAVARKLEHSPRH